MLAASRPVPGWRFGVVAPARGGAQGEGSQVTFALFRKKKSWRLLRFTGSSLGKWKRKSYGRFSRPTHSWRALAYKHRCDMLTTLLLTRLASAPEYLTSSRV